MHGNQKSGSAATFEVREDGGGAVKLDFNGRLDLESTAWCWRELRKELGHRPVSSLDVDASRLQFSGSIGLTLMKYLCTGGMTPGAKVTLHGLNPDMQKLLDQFAEREAVTGEPKLAFTKKIPQETGEFARGMWADLMDQIAFIGALIIGLFRGALHWRGIRWTEVLRTMEKAGANALPVITVFSWLIGMVMALEAARPLQKLGAEFFVADMIGFAAVRDIGPLVTAIMLAGRSGSAFAAELGTMKVNQELDALTTMGLDPIRFLVLPRVIGAILLTPMLTLYAIVMAIGGGVLVMRFLGYPPLMVYQEVVARVKLDDLAIGMEKAAVFGLIIGGIGCLRGLQTGGDPRAVGASTTRAVVAAILLVILADTAFSMTQYLLRR